MPAWEPAKLGDVVGRGGVAGNDSCLPDKVEHARRAAFHSIRVQVGAEELARLDLRPGFLAQLATEAVERMLALVEETAEHVPVAGVGIVRSAREQHSSCVVDDECCHGGRRFRVLNELAFRAPT